MTGGMIIVGTSDVAISGNVFSGVQPKALAVESEPGRRVVFVDNVLTDVQSEHAKLVERILKHLN